MPRGVDMPRRPLPLFSLALGLIAVVLAVTRPVRANNENKAGEAAANEFPRVRVEPTSGPAVEGDLHSTSVSLNTQTGSATIEMKHVRRITLQREEHGLGDVVE